MEKNLKEILNHFQVYFDKSVHKETLVENVEFYQDFENSISSVSFHHWL